MVIQTPNVDSYLCRLQKEKWEQFSVPGHLYFFSPKIMKMVLEKTGFKILKFDMRIPLFAPMDYGSLLKKISAMDVKQQKENPQIHRSSILKLLASSKSILAPFYNLLSQLKGRIIGKHDITVYAKKG